MSLYRESSSDVKQSCQGESNASEELCSYGSLVSLRSEGEILAKLGNSWGAYSKNEPEKVQEVWMALLSMFDQSKPDPSVC